MKITFWGVRGSFPVTSLQKLGYGGNTPCLEVQTNGSSVVIDAGTGIRGLGRALVERGQRDIEILLSHTHWDHIQGFPHFEPLYRDDTRIVVHSLRHEERSLQNILIEQQRSPFFPVSLEEAKAEVVFVEHDDAETFSVGELTVTCRRLNHPGVAGGYRMEHANTAMAYICDADVFGEVLMAHELPSSTTTDEKSRWLHKLRDSARDLGHRADWMVCDTFFLPDEYEPGWGHGSPDDALRLATESEAGGVILFHHRPGRTDTDLDGVCKRYEEQTQGKFQLLASKEGLEISL